jgi:hypothetical protein
MTVTTADMSANPPTLVSQDVPLPNPPQPGSIVHFARLQAGLGVLVKTPTPSAPNETSLFLYVLPDATPSVAPTPLEVARTSNVTAAVLLELAPSTYFVALNQANDPFTQFTLSGGIAGGGQRVVDFTTIDTNPSTAFLPFTPILAGSDLYLFANGARFGYYKLPPTASAASALQPAAPLHAGASGESLLDAVANGPDTTNLAFLEEDPVDGGYVNTFITGAFSNAGLASFSLADAGVPPLVQEYDDPGAYPCAGTSGLFGNDFVAIGSGCVGRGHTSWQNFIWLDMHGVVRASQTGVQGILQGQGETINTIGVSPGPRGSTTATWNVAFEKALLDDAGTSYNAVLLNALECHE